MNSMDEPIRQTYYLRVFLREPDSGALLATCCEYKHASRDSVLNVLRDHPLSKGFAWQLWDDLKEDWINPQQFWEDNL